MSTGTEVRSTDSLGGSTSRAGPRTRIRLPPWWLAVASVISISLGLNLWGLNHGLPYVYSPDERHHFVPKAVSFFLSGDFDPSYFINPPGYSYLFYVVFWAWFRGGR